VIRYLAYQTNIRGGILKKTAFFLAIILSIHFLNHNAQAGWDVSLVPKTTGKPQRPDIQRYGEMIHIAWDDVEKGRRNVYYMNGKSEGNTKVKKLTLSSARTGENHQSTSLGIWGKNVYVVWEESSAAGLYVAISRNTGNKFGKAKVLSGSGAQKDSLPKIVVFNKFVHLVFLREKKVRGKKITEVQYMRSKNKGKTWTKPIRLSDAGSNSLSLRISAWNKVVAAVWVEVSPQGNRIMVARSMNKGATWTKAKKLAKIPPLFKSDSTPTSASLPFITVLNEGIIVFYKTSSVMYRISKDLGKNWESPQHVDNFCTTGMHCFNASTKDDYFGICLKDGLLTHAITTDGGQTWNIDDVQQDSLGPFTHVSLTAIPEGTHFISTSGKDLYVGHYIEGELKKFTSLPFVSPEVRTMTPFGKVPWSNHHNGIDIGTKGTGKFFSCTNGTVREVDLNTRKGYAGTNYRINIRVTATVNIDYHFEIGGSASLTKRKANIFVKVGDTVKAGQHIANLLKLSDASHVHFLISENNEAKKCPLDYFAKKLAKRFEAAYDNIPAGNKLASRPDLCEK
jgi:hypothetical protein